MLTSCLVGLQRCPFFLPVVLLKALVYQDCPVESLPYKYGTDSAKEREREREREREEKKGASLLNIFSKESHVYHMRFFFFFFFLFSKKMRFGSSKKAKPSRSCCLEKRAFSIFRLKVGVLTFQNDCIRLIGLLILREISFLRSIFPFQKKLAGKKKEEEEEEEEMKRLARTQPAASAASLRSLVIPSIDDGVPLIR